MIMRSAAGRMLSAEFDRLYAAGNALLKQYDPCKITIENGKTMCTAARLSPRFVKPNTLCCGWCHYRSDKGCTIQCLRCKLSFCSEMGDYLPAEAEIVRKEMRALRRSVSFTELLTARKPKSHVIEMVLNKYY